ncbi:MAG: glycosyltransferase, partial [Bacteroidota bacterium]|nr:glycosyltransferase [Bacteroidota bacterium]
GIKKEHKNIKQIIQDYKIDGVISDNRFGISTSKAPCVFITHQLKIQSPFFTDAIQNFNYKYIHKYNACWIMDDKKTNLAGNLSKPNILPNNSIYIGPQSRFEYQDTKKKYDFLAIVSGPEPQRTILEKGLIKTLKDRKEKSLIVLGKPELKNKEQIGNLTTKSHLTAIELNTAMLQSKLVICRPGYSTIMDLARLGKKAIFIPTPGQTEQEYLANYCMQKKICFAQNQKNFNLTLAIKQTKSFTGFKKSFDSNTDWGQLFNVFK